MLFGILDEKNKYHRILRRGLIVGVLGFLACIMKEYIAVAPEAIIPLLTAIGVMIDKASREFGE